MARWEATLPIERQTIKKRTAQTNVRTLEKDLLNGYVNWSWTRHRGLGFDCFFTTSPSVCSHNVRCVANASTVFQGQSLNSNLLKGPDLLSNLTGVILRFREDKLALSKDIEQMFMQVNVTPDYRKFMRFLWINDGRIDTYEYTSHIFGATDSPCIASNALRKTARDNCEQFPDVIK